jgi:hypothetical protein
VSCIRRHPTAIDGTIIATEKKAPSVEKIADDKLAATTTNNSQYQYADREDLPLKFA